MASRAVQLSSKLKELRIHLCQNSPESKGVRFELFITSKKFIESYYVQLKQANPRFPILIRECSGIQPVLWARYDLGEEKSIPLTNLSAEDVVEKIKSV